MRYLIYNPVLDTNKIIDTSKSIETLRTQFFWQLGTSKTSMEWVRLQHLDHEELDRLCLEESVLEWVTLLCIREKQYRNLTLEGIPDQV